MLKMKEKIIRLNKFVHNVCGSCFFLATGFLCLLAVFIAASHFGFFEPSSTWVPSESSYKKQTTTPYGGCLQETNLFVYKNKSLCRDWKLFDLIKKSISCSLHWNRDL